MKGSVAADVVAALQFFEEMRDLRMGDRLSGHVGQQVLFRNVGHIGGLRILGQQVVEWLVAARPDFLDRATGFVGPLESAATLGVMRAFRVYKPAPADAAFLEVPPECLILTMQQNQKYFALQGADGQLLNRFLLVSNVEPADARLIIDSNARVVRARLADAAFFWEQDRREPLAARRGGLEAVTFQAKLGSLGDKTRRVRAPAAELREVGGADRRRESDRAAWCRFGLLPYRVAASCGRAPGHRSRPS